MLKRNKKPFSLRAPKEDYNLQELTLIEVEGDDEYNKSVSDLVENYLKDLEKDEKL
jgi:hypothetical protein